jgi:hypothetical protein
MGEESQNTDIKVALIQKDVSYIKQKLDQGFSEIPRLYVTRAEFEPVRNLVYGMTALMLSAVVIALLTLIIKQN